MGYAFCVIGAEHNAQPDAMQRAYPPAVKISSGRHLRRRQNLLLLIEEAGGPTSLAIRIHSNKTHVSAMANGTRGIGDDIAQRLEREFRKGDGWMDQQHAPEGASVVGVAQDLSHARQTIALPRFTWEMLMQADMTQPFELVVADDALGPELFPGCVVRFDPIHAREPRPGRPVLVRDGDGRYYLRDYELGPNGSWRAVARQRGFAPLDSSTHGLTVVAVMKGFDWP